MHAVAQMEFDLKGSFYAFSGMRELYRKPLRFSFRQQLPVCL